MHRARNGARTGPGKATRKPRRARAGETTIGPCSPAWLHGFFFSCCSRF
ncbi:Hypothetical protein A7982_10253 [Minicystis rosea]|nr:Hypothetical protein A7982_10253 [Minicystis rosea]